MTASTATIGALVLLAVCLPACQELPARAGDPMDRPPATAARAGTDGFRSDVDNGDGTRTLVVQPGPGRNDGTDQGTLEAGKDAFVYLRSGVYPDDASSWPWLPHDRSTCNEHTGWSYYRFDVADLPPADRVVRVTFVLWQVISRAYGWSYQGAPSTAYRLYPVTSRWEENTIRWSSRPSHGDPLVEVELPTPARGHEIGDNGLHVLYNDHVELDITSQYRDWKTGVPNHGLMYARVPAWCENGNASYTASSDADPEWPALSWLQLDEAELRPKLVLVYRADPPGSPPRARPGGPYTASEGDTVSFHGTGSPRSADALLAYAWDFGDGAVATGASPTHVYGDDGDYPVTLAVAAGDHVVTATTTASVRNVPPRVALQVRDEPLLPGEPMAGVGSFVDPGADAWSAVVDWGEGDGLQPLALDGFRFALDHAFDEPGTYRITVRVSDDDGGVGQTTVRVRVTRGDRGAPR